MSTDTIDTEEPSLDPTADISAMRLGIALIISAGVSWAIIQFLPNTYQLPERLTSGTVANSADLQAEAAAMNAENQVKNALIKMALIGAAFGLFPTLIATVGSLARTIALSASGLLLGAFSGAFAAWAAFQVRSSWGFDDPALSDTEPSMYADICIMLVQSVFVVLPCAIVFLSSGLDDRVQKLAVVPVAGILVGLLTPVLASFAFPEAKTDSVPILDGGLSLAWLALLTVTTLVLSQITKAKDSPVTEAA